MFGIFIRYVKKLARTYCIVLRDQVEFIEPRGRLQRIVAAAGCAVPSVPVTLRLLAFDRRIAEETLPEASWWMLRKYYAGFDNLSGRMPSERLDNGGVLLIANHTGLADALALLRWWNRRDVWIVTRERDLFRSLPALHSRIISIGSTAEERRELLRTLPRLLENGAGVLLFPAGRIEPDPWFFDRVAESAAKTRVSDGEANSNGSGASSRGPDSMNDGLLNQWPGLIGYLVEQARKAGYSFTVQSVLTGNVYGPAAARVMPLIARLMRLNKVDDLQKLMAFLTFTFRLSRRQHIQICPLEPVKTGDLPLDLTGKKAITSHFRTKLLLAAQLCRCSRDSEIETILVPTLYRPAIESNTFE